MRRGVPTIAGLLLMGLGLGPWLGGCGGEPEASRSEVQALLQRLDAMERRLDALEQATPAAPPTRPPTVDTPVVAPFARPRADPAEPPALHVTVTPMGITIEGEAMTRQQALRRFESEAAKAPPPRLVVMAEPSVSYTALVDALDLAHEAGLERVAVSARLHGPDEPAPE